MKHSSEHCSMCMRCIHTTLQAIGRVYGSYAVSLQSNHAPQLLQTDSSHHRGAITRATIEDYDAQIRYPQDLY